MLGLVREGRSRYRDTARSPAEGVERLTFGGVAVELLSREASTLRPSGEDGRFCLGPAAGPTLAVLHCAARVDRTLDIEPTAAPPNAVECRGDANHTSLVSSGLDLQLAPLGAGRYAASARVAATPDAGVKLLRAATTTVLRLEGGLALHAAAVEIAGRAVAFLGPSGAGKSTAVRLSAPLRCVAEDHVALVPTPGGWFLWAMPGGTPSGAAASSRIVMPLAGLARIRQGRGRVTLTPLSGSDALFAIREAVESDDCSVEAEVARLGAVDRLAREVEVAAIHTVPGEVLGPTLSRWLDATPGDRRGARP